MTYSLINILMKIKNILTFLILFLLFFEGNGQVKKYEVHTIAFYNFENLFDTINDSNYDEEWLPDGLQNWTSKKYHQKLHNLAWVISEIGTNNQHKAPPTLLGCAEVENRGVLEDLIKEPKLINQDYGIVHFDSPDKRGIDVALLYQKNSFKPTSYKNIPLLIYQNSKRKKSLAEINSEDEEVEEIIEKRIYTRDQLLVTGLLNGEEIHVIVNHWPSRSGGEKKSAPYRYAAAQLNRKIMDSLFQINPNAKIITMGDFNDGVYDKSIKEGLGAQRKKEDVQPLSIYNPFEELFYKGNATIFYKDAGDIFDQIMLTEAFLPSDYSSFRYWKAGIFNKPFMITPSGKYKGYPLRHSATEVGFSDHFPVYVYLIKEF